MTALLLATLLTLMEWNVENLFDCQHDSLKDDYAFTPEGIYHWTKDRYWTKLNRIGQTLLAVNDGQQADKGKAVVDYDLPDLVALCEVENDTCLRDLTRRSLLRKAGYEYVMTSSPDRRGIDVALLYSPFSFRLIASRSIRVDTLPGMKPTRDILYACGEIMSGDTLHVFVVHAPSRSGGEAATRPYREHAAKRVAMTVDSLLIRQPEALIVIAGDFNDYSGDSALAILHQHGMTEVSLGAKGRHGAEGTYCYRGTWGSLDHVFASRRLSAACQGVQVFDAPYLLTYDDRYNQYKPNRNYLGPAYHNGYSDHLPLVARFSIEDREK